MHEFSIVQSLLALIEEHAHERGAKKVTKVVLRVGVLSGVEAHLLKVAFDTFKEGTVAQEAELVIKQEKLKVFCKDCNETFEKDELNALCPKCGSLNTEIVGGEDLLLESLEMEC